MSKSVVVEKPIEKSPENLSLFDQELAKKSKNPIAPITRFFHVITCEDPGDVKDVTFNISKHIDASSRTDRPLTGFGLSKDHVIFNLVEGDSSRILEYIEFIGLMKEKNPKVRKVLVLVHNDELPQRAFFAWAHAHLNSQEVIRSELEKNEAETEDLVWVVYKKFLDAGKEVAPKLLAEKRFDSETIKETLDRLYLNSDELSVSHADFYPDLTEIYELYYADSEVQTDSHRNWPCDQYYCQLLEYKQNPFETYNDIKFT